jgi:hypothetical protein
MAREKWTPEQQKKLLRTAKAVNKLNLSSEDCDADGQRGFSSVSE